MRRWLGATLVWGGLAAALGTSAWIVTEQARAGYLSTEPLVAIEPGGDGWATIDGSSVRVMSFEQERVVKGDYGERVQAPEGYRIWRLEIAVESDLDDTVRCQPRVIDERGRTFTPVDDAAVDLPVWNDTELDCGARDDPSLETRFVLPEDATPVRLDLVDDSGWNFSPEFYRFPLTDR